MENGSCKMYNFCILKVKLERKNIQSKIISWRIDIQKRIQAYEKKCKIKETMEEIKFSLKISFQN